MEIREFEFSSVGLQSLKQHPQGQNWPVVYLINNDNARNPELYVGETTSAGNRFQQHLGNKARKKLNTIRFIFNEEFNKSAILDIEQTLIQMFMADQKFVLQNKNGGQSCKHDYYQRVKYQNMVETIWDHLYKESLANHDASTIKNTNLFKYSPYNTLTPEQEQVSQDILLNVMDCLEKGKTGTAILSGKAGTGKSIVLIHMMYTLMSAMSVTYNDTDLTEDEELELRSRLKLASRIVNYVKNHGTLKIAFVVPMTSIRKTFKSVFSASKSAGLKSGMVIGPQDVLKKDYDVVFVDESHRLARRKGITSYGSFDDACEKLGLDNKTASQLDMIQMKSKYSVLVYDENQTVKAADITQKQFNKAIKLHGKVIKKELCAQMRCKGGQLYIDYLDKIFDCSQKTQLQVENYDFKIWDDPNAMIRDILKKEKKHSLCRIVAGYSWKWISKKSKTIPEAVKKGLQDIDLDGQKYVWNMSNKEWILRKGAVNEIGCVHTTQGYDLNYVAVIFGQEIDYDGETNSFVIDRNKFYDTKVKDGVDDVTLSQYIINAYKVMMMRGIKGCYVYACNPSMRKYLSKFITKA